MVGATANWIPVKVVPPDRAERTDRAGHASFLDHNGTIFLVGGKGRSSFDVSRLDINTQDPCTVTITDANLYQGAHDADAYQDSKQFTSNQERGPKLEPRFAFAHVYCEREQVLFMHGGFDMEFNHSGTSFLVATGHSSYSIKTLCSENQGPSPRGYHSAVYLPPKTSKGRKSSRVITFGGQCCMGGPYTFFNDVYSLDLATMEWTRLSCHGQGPSPRSQSYAFVLDSKDEFLYIYGGYDGRHIFTDLHRLNLSTLLWEQLATWGTRPPGLKELSPLDFHVYFCQPCGVVVRQKRLVVLAENYYDASSTLYSLNLRTLEWQVITSQSQFVKKSDKFRPPARGNPTLIMTKDERLYLIGGHIRSTDMKDDPKRTWSITLPGRLPWSSERLLWLACYKNDPSLCNLAKCPPHLIYKIIGYINSNSFV